MKKFSIIIFSIVFFTACVSEQKQKAAEIIANTWQAESAIIGHSYGKDTKTNQIELTLTNLKGVDADYSPKKITSVSAMMLYQSLNPKEYKNDQEINIVVENNGENYELAYSIESLKTAEKSFQILDLFFDAFEENSIEKYLNTIDAKFINDSIAKSTFSLMQSLEKESGKMPNRTATGFDFNRTLKGNIPVIIVTNEISNDSSYSEFRFMISLESNKIMSIRINPED